MHELLVPKSIPIILLTHDVLQDVRLLAKNA
jgi:hypothetical protein